ncbi:SMI1/KNR4 family protein [Streptomyces viridosporus]|uniref:SMI1/KNR4 family protein n=1 Tax=Streptomyces viridosporus TaxID=67581 RepID=UPI00343A0EE2
MWDADDVRERVRVMAEADPECRSFSARRHRWRLAPPVPESVVARYEREHRFELPASYRSFITTVSSGGAGPAYGLYEFGNTSWLDWQEDLDLLSVPFPHDGPFCPSPERSVCAEHAPGEEDFSPCWFTGSLVVAEIGCGSFYRLVVTGPDRGQVWTDDLGCGDALSPGPDFREWYERWLYRSR